MELQSSRRGMAGRSTVRTYGLPVTEGVGVPHADAVGATEDVIRGVVVEFYRRARLDERLGPVFEAHIDDWDEHMTRMTDFWSAALLRTGRYSGTPVERHRSIEELSHGHFGRWITLFEATVHDLCQSREAEAFLDRARRMRVAMSKVLGVDD